MEKLVTIFIFLCLITSGNFFAGCSSNAHKKRLVTKRFLNISGKVVIDPGHGGRDFGAVGKRGLKEKDLTLDIAFRLKNLFRTFLPNVAITMTRSSDKYVGLEQRIALANKKQGDLFISLHVNASESKKAGGFEIYSLDIASDRHAERLAARENKDFKQSQQGLQFILADLRAFSNRKESDRLAKFVALGLQTRLKKQFKTLKTLNRGYNQAIFHVLFVKMPAVLAELFFISNPQEERMLAKKATRQMIAQGIFLGVYRFLKEKKLGQKHATLR